MPTLNHHLIGLIHKSSFKKQFIFKKTELIPCGFKDPLNEDKFKKTKGLIYRYPDRVVLTTTNRCFAYCRFCFRKNNWEHFEGFSLKEAIKYIEKNKQIREVLISGGDPLTLENGELEKILNNLREIKHIEVIRIGTRALTSNPKRINRETVNLFSRYKPLWIAIHINHPDEITKEFRESARLIVSSGIPVISQTVLLKGINDNTGTLKKLFCELVKNSIKPYYLFGCDAAFGNGKFRVPTDKALELIKKLRGWISGICMPTFTFDLQKGGGKVVLEPNCLVKREKNRLLFKNFEGKEFWYEDI